MARWMRRLDTLRVPVEGLAPYENVALRREETVDVIELVLALADQARGR